MGEKAALVTCVLSWKERKREEGNLKLFILKAVHFLNLLLSSPPAGRFTYVAFVFLAEKALTMSLPHPVGSDI